MSTPTDELRQRFLDRHMRIEKYQECMIAPLPHFLPAEQLIFCEWMHEYKQYGEYIFDLPLYPELSEYKEKIEREVMEAMKYMLALKVDAVKIESGYTISLIEVKRRGLVSGIGQLLTYRERFMIQYPNIYIADMIYVTTMISKEVEAVARKYGIKVYILPWLSQLAVRYKIGER